MKETVRERIRLRQQRQRWCFHQSPVSPRGSVFSHRLCSNMRNNRNQIWALIVFWGDVTVYSAAVLHPVSSSSSASCCYLCPCCVDHISNSSTFCSEDLWHLRDASSSFSLWEGKQTERGAAGGRSVLLHRSTSGRGPPPQLLSGSHSTAGKHVPVETHTSFTQSERSFEGLWETHGCFQLELY